MQNPNELSFPETHDAPNFQVHHMGGHTDSFSALRGSSASKLPKIVLGVVVLAAGVFGFQKLTAPPEPGTAVLQTTPAEVGISLDGAGIAMQKSPIKLEGLSHKKKHVIEINAEGFKPQTVEFDIAEGEVKTLAAVALEAVKVDTGFALDSKPTGATVLVDGAKLGVTPLRTTTLQPGKHTVRIENGFTHEAWEGSVEPTAGQVVEMQTVELVALPKWKVKRAERAAKQQARLQAKLSAKRGATHTTDAVN